MRALTLMLLMGCRTQPLAEDLSPPSDLASLQDLTSSSSQVVNCGSSRPCSIAAGEHCCESTPLYCTTSSCGGFREYDCDGPEDCPGGVCCYRILEGVTVALCSADCSVGDVVLCHAQADCPARTVCCLNFVLGGGNGMCLGACD